MWEISCLDWQLELGRCWSLELLLRLLMLVLMVLLLMVHPWGGAIGVMWETLTSLEGQVNGP